MKFIKHWIAATILTLCAAAHGADYYGASGDPATGSALSSSVLRAEYSAIGAGFAKVAPYTGNANKAVIINSGATGQTVTTGTLGLAGNFATTGAFNTTLIQGATTSLTLPLVSGTLATLAGIEELTNKTMNASVGKGTWTTSGTWTLPAVTLGGAITYGGVTLSNSVTGTGKMVLDTAPTLGAITVTSVNGNTLTTGSSTYTGTAGQTYTFPTTSATIARTDAANTFAGVQTFTTPVINGLPTGTGVATANTVSTLVARDSNGDFAARIVTAALAGNATTATDTASKTGTGSTYATSASPTFTGTVNAAAISASGTISAAASLRSVPTVGTTAAFTYFGNTGGDYYVGAESSPGGSLLAASTGYALVINAASNNPVQIGSNNVKVASFASGATSLTGTLDVSGTTVNMVASGTTLTVGVGANNGTVSAGVFTDRTKYFDGDALAELGAVKGVDGHIDHATLPEFARASVKKDVMVDVQKTVSGKSVTVKEKVGEETVVERDLGAMISMLTVAVNQLTARLNAAEKKLALIESAPVAANDSFYLRMAGALEP